MEMESSSDSANSHFSANISRMVLERHKGYKAVNHAQITSLLDRKHQEGTQCVYKHETDYLINDHTKPKGMDEEREAESIRILSWNARSIADMDKIKLLESYP